MPILMSSARREEEEEVSVMGMWAPIPMGPQIPLPHFDTRLDTRLGFGAIFNTRLHVGG